MLVQNKDGYRLVRTGKIKGVVRGTNAGDVAIVNQVVLVDTAGNVSGTYTYTGAASYSATQTYTGAIVSSLVTQSTSTTTGAIKTAGGLGVAKNAHVGGLLVPYQAFVQNHTGVAIASTAAGTLAVVTSGVVAGLITSTSAAGVTLTLDSVANMITAFATAGVTIGTGTLLTFMVDNSQGSNTVTVAVDSGATLAVTTPVLTGGATLTVSTANAFGIFGIYITSATTGKLLRLY